MPKELTISSYHYSITKRLFDFVIATLGIVLFTPLIMVISIFIKLGSIGPVFYFQERMGKNRKHFSLIKFRTMKSGANKLQKRLMHLNEADGPVFKIRNDPRFVGIGKFLAITGLDELPQLINVFLGSMSLVGPRPLPINEAKKLTKNQHVRHLIKPGMTSLWVIKGAHVMNFEKWMQLDRKYLKNSNLAKDIKIIIKTINIVERLLIKQLKKIKTISLVKITLTILFILLVIGASEIIYNINKNTKKVVDYYLYRSHVHLNKSNYDQSLFYLIKAAQVNIQRVSKKYPDIQFEKRPVSIKSIDNKETQTELFIEIRKIDYDVLSESYPNEWSKHFYNLGLIYYQNGYFKNTESLWFIARQLAPEWSYFYIESANLHLIQGHTKKAEVEIAQCKKFEWPQEHCENYYNDFIKDNMKFPVGDWKEEINNI